MIPTRGIICVGDLDNKMKLDTEQLSPRQSIYLDKMSSDIKSTERADDVPSYNQSVMSNRQASFAQSWENRNNLDDVRSYNQSVIFDRQETLLTTCSFGHRPVYFVFPNSDQDLLAYQTILMTCSFEHRPDYFGFPNSEQDLLAY
jgi:hypothetical protein